MKKIISTSNAPQAIGPYSQAIEINGLIFISGQIPLLPENGLVVEGGVAEQTEQVLKNLLAVLETAGCDLENVVKTTCYLKSMNDFVTMNEVYGRFFVETPPARAAVEVSRLPKDVLVEIEAIAYK